ncbi:MAG: hypothetical protein MAG581_01054 [Deltaproteobacteria bacterium]|jgi:hypothetical protein|nr:hypothetical protein [Deltaproteobacteria bacterium]
MGGYFPFLVKFEAKNDHYQFIFQIKSFIFNIGYGNVGRQFSFNRLKKFENYLKIKARKTANSAI